MKLQQIIESESDFDNLTYKSIRTHSMHINDKILSFKKEYDFIHNKRGKIYFEFIDWLALNLINSTNLNYCEIFNTRTNLPEVQKYNNYMISLTNLLTNINNKISKLKERKLRLLNPGTEDTTIDPNVGISNPLKLALYKNGAPHVKNPYFIKSATNRYAGDPAKFKWWSSSTRQRQYEMCCDLLKRHHLPRLTRMYAAMYDNLLEFIMIGNDGNFVWWVQDVGQAASNIVYINGHKIYMSQLYEHKKNILKLDVIFNQIMNEPPLT
jgi:hypothetical protein